MVKWEKGGHLECIPPYLHVNVESATFLRGHHVMVESRGRGRLVPAAAAGGRLAAVGAGTAVALLVV